MLDQPASVLHLQTIAIDAQVLPSILRETDPYIASAPLISSAILRMYDHS